MIPCRWKRGTCAGAVAFLASAAAAFVTGDPITVNGGHALG